MKQVFLSLGGNVGDVQATLQKSFDMLAGNPHIFQFRASSLHQTKAVSDIPQADFLNGACAFLTDLTPTALFALTQEIEKKLGKVEKAKNAPRRVDIDIIWYNGETVSEQGLEIPHPRWSERLFVLEPLLELTSHLGRYDIKREIEKLQ